MPIDMLASYSVHTVIAMHHIHDLITLFNRLFGDSENTVLVAGEDEPVYLPGDGQHAQHRIVFAHGFFASALHEIAHWCIAGSERRQQIDYGYWYEPDGRTASQQLDFAKVEAKPQALEWILAQSCGHRFVISLDNLSGEAVDITPFRTAVLTEIRRFQQQGINARTEKLQKALSAFYRQPPDYRTYPVNFEDLQ